MRTRRQVLALLSPIGVAAAAAAGGTDAWAIYLDARRVAGGGSGPGGLSDYSYDLISRVPSGEQRVTVRSSVALVFPDAFRQQVQTPNGEVTLRFDGARAWRESAAGRGDLPAAAVAMQASELQRRHVFHAGLPEKVLVRARESQQIQGRPVDVVEILDVGGSPLRLFLDSESKDLVKTMFVGDVPGGGMAQVEEYFSDYRVFGTIRWALQRRILRNGVESRSSTLSNVRINAGLSRSDVLS